MAGVVTLPVGWGTVELGAVGLRVGAMVKVELLAEMVRVRVTTMLDVLLVVGLGRAVVVGLVGPGRGVV